MTQTYTAIFCDDIRQEANGKHILIGVYGADLLPSTLPATLPLSLWLRVAHAPVGKHHFRLGLRSGEGNEIGIEGEFEIPDNGSSDVVVLGVGALPVTIEAPGAVLAILSLDDGTPVEVGSLQVKAPPPAN